jgi:hypothetical protein
VRQGEKYAEKIIFLVGRRSEFNTMIKLRVVESLSIINIIGTAFSQHRISEPGSYSRGIKTLDEESI